MAFNAGDTIIAPGLPNCQVFNTSGTWTKPAGLRAVMVEVVGGGGGSGGCATTGASQVSCSPGGGGGGYSRELIQASALGSTETVTVGAGGTAGAATPTNGGNGGTSSFGTVAFLSATGGAGSTSVAAQAQQGAVGTGGSGGTGSGGDLNIGGGRGFYATLMYGAVARAPGGTSILSSTEPGGTSSSGIAGADGELYGGGAHGACNGQSQGTARAGGAGAAGVVIVTTYF